MTRIPTPKYKIGDTVFHASRFRQRKMLQCPDCLGRRIWSVTAPSGETWETSCYTCERGWGGSTGTIERWEVDDYIEALTIGSVRIDTAAKDDEIVSYMCWETGVGSGTIYYEGRLHATREAAKAWCDVVAKQEVDAENARLDEKDRARKKEPRGKPERKEKS